jgi:hypothetical protein
MRMYGPPGPPILGGERWLLFSAVLKGALSSPPRIGGPGGPTPGGPTPAGPNHA